MKRCYKCNTIKPLDEFYKHKNSKDGHARVCKACNRSIVKNWRLKNKDRSVEAIRKWRKKNPDKEKQSNRNSKIKKIYNITSKQYDQMYQDQLGCCAICNTHQDKLQKRLSIDHDHETLKIRELLCNSCNSLLGYARESEEILLAAIAYLRKHKKER